jgi:hypothetical protein
MPTINEYHTKALIVVRELFPSLTEDAQEALAWMISDFLASLNAIE